MSKEVKCGIYKITNIINGKAYIGQAQDIERRWYAHRYYALNEKSNSYNCVLYRAIRKYGLDNFKFKIIEECSIEELNEREMYYIEKYNTYICNKNSWGYNMTLGGDGTRGYKMSEEELKRMSERMKGRFAKGKNPKAKKVVCEGKIFDSILECAEYYKTSKERLASYVVGRSPMPKEWYDKGLRLIDKDIKDYKIMKENHKGENSALSCPIICEEKIFYTLEEFCCYHEGTTITTVWNWLNGTNPMPKDWEEKGLKYLDGHTNNIIIYQDEEYFKKVHKNRSESQKGKIPSNSYKVFCEDKIFDTVTKCAEYYGINNGTMKGWISGRDKMPQEWYNKGLRREDKVMEDYEIAVWNGKRKVICEGMEFESLAECSRYYNESKNKMSNWILGITNMPKKFYDMQLHYSDTNFEECNYKVQTDRKGENSSQSKPVICEEIEYSCVEACSNHYNTNTGTMREWLNHNNNMPINFYNMGLRYKDEPMENYKYSTKKKMIICDNQIFDSIKDCASYYEINSSTMQKWLCGKNGMPQKFKDLGLDYYIK